MTDWDAIEDQAMLATNDRKDPARGKRAVVSSHNAIVTEVALRTMRAGGNAADAAVAASLVQSTIEQHATNHTGIVSCLYYDASTRQVHQLEATGTFPSRLPLHRPCVADPMQPASCIPHQIAGLGSLHEKFGTRPWAELCQDAVYWAERGHKCTRIESQFMAHFQTNLSFFAESRAHFMPDDRIPHPGEQRYSADLAHTMRHLAEEGPTYFSEGEWAEKFVAKAKELGWPITLADMTEVEPMWCEPTRYMHRGVEVVQQAPPQIQAALSGLVLGILDALGTRDKGHFTESADALFDMAHALRWAGRDLTYLNDPQLVEPTMATYLDPDYHRHVARIIDAGRPKVDLTNHVSLTSGPLLRRAGYAQRLQDIPTGSCENVYVDSSGNWCQLMNTLQSGGIPGMVVGGVSMMGSHAQIGSWNTNAMAHAFGGYLAPGARLKMPIANTMLFKDGAPWMSLGSTGNVHCTPPQVLSNLLDYGMDPIAAVEAARINPLSDDGSVIAEGVIDDAVVDGLAARGVRLNQGPRWQPIVGQFAMAQRDPQTGLMNAYADPRGAGNADGIE